MHIFFDLVILFLVIYSKEENANFMQKHIY